MPAFDVRPLSESFGAEIGGIDLARLSDAEFTELERVFFDRRVLALRAQTLTPAQFVAFARCVGPSQPHVADPGRRKRPDPVQHRQRESEPFVAVCGQAPPPPSPAWPFQCDPPSRPLDWRDFAPR